MALNFPIPTAVGEEFIDETTGNLYTCLVIGPPAVWVTGDGTPPSADSFVTINTAQTITGDKTFNADVTVGPTSATALVTIDKTSGNITTSGDVITSDLVMSNMHRAGNEVDGTTGHWTLQEGEDSLYVINRLSGKRYAMALTPVD
jgi:hypothetical protein